MDKVFLIKNFNYIVIIFICYEINNNITEIFLNVLLNLCHFKNKILRLYLDLLMIYFLFSTKCSRLYTK